MTYMFKGEPRWGRVGGRVGGWVRGEGSSHSRHRKVQTRRQKPLLLHAMRSAACLPVYHSKHNSPVPCPRVCDVVFRGSWGRGGRRGSQCCGCIFDMMGRLSCQQWPQFFLRSAWYTPDPLLVPPHGSNDPLIILYSDALIKLMC